MEGNLLRTLVPVGIDQIQLMDLEGEAFIQKLVFYFQENMRSRRHRSYGVWFLVTDILNLGSVLADIFILQKFFDGRFFQYGINFIRLGFFGDIDAKKSLDLFPLVARCRIYRSGPSG